MTDFKYHWTIEGGYPEKNGLKVFSTFACGGGSTMGYKLAGFDVIGANDIDPQMAAVYKQNHKPRYFYECPIKDLLDEELPPELYDLDILDGSPPCSTFSMAGKREAGWKKEKKFREGQAKQILSDLFFDWIDLVAHLKPKVAVAENVKGMLVGNARSYTQVIINTLNEIGYDVQLFLLNSAKMGVPQQRERVFFICRRKDLNMPEIKLNFSGQPIVFKKISDEAKTMKGDVIEQATELYTQYWHQALPGESVGKFKSNKKIHPLRVANTLHTGSHYHYSEPRLMSKYEYCMCGTFPIDYKFLNNSIAHIRYLIGMSVPPVMMAQVANQIYLQLFKQNGQ